MLERLIIACTDNLIRRNAISADDREIYEYGFHSAFSNAIAFIMIGMLAIGFRCLFETVIYYIVFITMRNTAGGYHAKTQSRCFLLTIVVWLVSIWIISHLFSVVMITAITVLSTIIVFSISPIEHENNPMSRDKFKKMKVLCRAFEIFFTLVAAFVCFCINKSFLWVASAISVGMISHSILAFVVVIMHINKQHFNKISHKLLILLHLLYWAYGK